MKRYLIILACLFIMLLSCSKKTTIQVVNSTDGMATVGYKLEKVEGVVYSVCDDPSNYIPDTTRMYLYPERTLRLIFHIMNSADGSKNYTVDRARSFFWLLMQGAQEHITNNIKMNLPEDNATPVLPIGFKYKKVTVTEDLDQDGYLHHFDNERYFFINKGKNRNNYHEEVITKYEVGNDSILNVFVMPHHPDSVASSTYRANNTGIALGNSLKIAGLYETKGEPWQFNSLLNHEIGHVLGLRHSWIKRDGCDDTPPHANCFGRGTEAPCNGVVSNNMMDYNNSQRALTPCQIGIIHRNFSNLYSMQRKLIEKDWCAHDTSFVISIHEEEAWEGSRDLTHSIVIEKGGKLTLCCRLSMPEGSSIRIMPGGELHLKGSRIHNDCGQFWNGIEIVVNGKKKGKFFFEDGSKIENVKEVSLD